MTRPMTRLPKNTKRKLQVASKTLRNPSLWPLFLYSLAVSKRTIVTGSVAERVAPTIMASIKSILTASSFNLVQRNKMTPRTTADMKVPAKANVNMEPMLRKKLV
jgi:hypothetical protein